MPLYLFEYVFFISDMMCGTEHLVSVKHCGGIALLYHVYQIANVWVKENVTQATLPSLYLLLSIPVSLCLSFSTVEELWSPDSILWSLPLTLFEAELFTRILTFFLSLYLYFLKSNQFCNAQPSKLFLTEIFVCTYVCIIIYKNINNAYITFSFFLWTSGNIYIHMVFL